MWQPGQPVVTEQDEAEWQEWKKARALKLQRERRATLRRIDYYPSKEAAAVIDSQRRPYAHGDASSIIDRMIAEWLENKGHSGIN